MRRRSIMRRSERLALVRKKDYDISRDLLIARNLSVTILKDNERTAAF